MAPPSPVVISLFAKKEKVAASPKVPANFFPTLAPIDSAQSSTINNLYFMEVVLDYQIVLS